MLGTATIKVRPTKMALLVDPQNTVQVREAIRLASSLWGGNFFPIIPVYLRAPTRQTSHSLLTPSAKEKLLGYIDAFDPDLLVQFSENAPAYLANTSLQVIKPRDVWERLGSLEHPAYGMGVFTLLNDVYKQCFKYKARYPIKFVIPKIPNEHALFWASVFGEYTDTIGTAIANDYADTLDIEWPEATVETFLAMMHEQVLFPRAVTKWGMSVEGGLGFGNHANVFFMDANKTDDVIDYWNLRAAGRAVLPLPKQFYDEPSFKRVFEEFIKSERRYWGVNSEIIELPACIPSQHSNLDEIRSFVSTIGLKQSTEASREHYSLQHWYPRFWSEWARPKDGDVADIYATGEKSIDINDTTGLRVRLDPLLPDFIQTDWVYTDAFCANEIYINIYGADEYLAEVYPKIEGKRLASAISGIASLRDQWRIGRHGLVKLVKNRISESRTIPSAETVFFAWLKDRDWDAELSPPGKLAKQIFKRLDGYPQLLGDRSALGLIEHMNGGSVQPNGRPHREDHFVGPREVKVGEVKRRLDGNGQLRLTDTLVSKGVFRLGLQAQCPTCQQRSWFALNEFREMFECPKCLSTFPAAGNIDKAPGEWHYRTVGPFSVPQYAQGAYAVLLTINALRSDSRRPFRATAVPSFIATSPGRERLEADLAMFWRESNFTESRDGLLFGECKTYGLFKKEDFDRMRYLGETFPGSVLVFSTLRDSLTTKETASIRRQARLGRRQWKSEMSVNPVLVLTGNELLNPLGPPYCWTDEQRKRLGSVGGLLGICDATQQLYLGLPPLHQEWRERNEQRRARRTQAE